MSIDRRQLLALPGLAALGQPALVLARTASLAPTPADSKGPFYPEDWSGEADADLLTVGSRLHERGTPLLITGRVLATDGSPLAGATVEIWQADTEGEYRHSRDGRDGPLKRGFQGYGRMLAGADGSYRFRTLRPPAYGGRPPHVHFRVKAAGRRPLTTQMYFAGENTERSGWGGFSRERERLTVTLTPTQDAGRAAVAATFDLVLG
jgi:protocatechuate 3,4-dioxygenase beta subunit